MLNRLLRVLMMVFVAAGGARADDAFYRVPVTGLKLTEGALPKEDEDRWRWDVPRPYVVLDGPGEAYVTVPMGDGQVPTDWAGRWSNATGVLVARGPAGQDLKGSLFVPSGDGLAPLRFAIASSEASAGARREFYTAMEAHYNLLQLRGGPGTAWYRRRATEAHRALGDEPREGRPPFIPGREMEDTYELFVGGRALSENLQLSRDLPGPRRGEAPVEAEAPAVPVSSIEGVTVASMDWGAVSKPALDALAGAIPADQHAVFFPSFDALMALADETDAHGLPIFRSVGERSEDAGVIARYQKQLCLQPSALARLLGPKVVRSVAITGSDPYFPTGTDVAVIFEAADGGEGALKDVILAQVGANAAAVRDAAPVAGEAEGIAYNGMASADRAVRSYVAVVGKSVVVANSVGQIVRLAGVQAGRTPAIASLPEYWFFRTRYPVGAGGETGFVFLSDATIRRWCGPAWRIGASRRLRAAAIMADVAAAHLDELVAGVNAPVPVEADTPMRTIGVLTLGPGGVRSSVYGSPAFMTPIAELGITEVAADEAAAYKRWRDTYQRNWSWAFDPIAISFGIEKSRMSADMTVMPLIVASEYRTWMDVARGVKIGADSGDPHDTIAHGVLAVNRESRPLKEGAGMAQMFAPGVEIDPLGWLGQSVAVYADPDPFWGELLSAKDPSEFWNRNFPRMPVGVCVEVGSALKLTAFLAAARGAIEQAAPGMSAWETRAHHDQAYVRVGLSEKARAESRGGESENAALYYAATPRALYVSLNEDLIKRAIDRQAGEQPAAGAEGTRKSPWLGESMCVQVSAEGLRLLGGSGGSMLRQVEQRRCWSNLEILNEWRRRYPGKDPVKVHAEQWGTTLVCPGGGAYVWNERFRTMESTVYGHPGEPKAGPDSLGALSGITAGNFGLTFEERGLRAKAVVERAAR